MAPGEHSVSSWISLTHCNHCTTSWDIVGCFLSHHCFTINGLFQDKFLPSHSWSTLTSKISGIFQGSWSPKKCMEHFWYIRGTTADVNNWSQRACSHQAWRDASRRHLKSMKPCCFVKICGSPIFHAWRMAAVSAEANGAIQGGSGRLENTELQLIHHHHIYNVLYFLKIYVSFYSLFSCETLMWHVGLSNVQLTF